MRSLDLPVLFDNHAETFSPYTSSEATSMTRITVILAAVLSFMAFTPVAAQDFQKGLDAYDAGDYSTALQEWPPLAEAGFADAQYNLGGMYENGQGVPQDYAEAVRWYRLAADQGYAIAQTSLGYMYENGSGVPQDYAEAVRLFRLAADQGYAIAQASLGHMYENGKGVLQDNVMAQKCSLPAHSGIMRPDIFGR
ncbi:sel1 repeat family protein [Octadecabacter sp.]|nr:sel1 repeat family protein [Octadecabacter sp.]